MTNPREPLTFGDAITRIVGTLTMRVARGIVRRSPRTLYAWMDPADPTTPSLSQALALEAAFHAAGGEGSPVQEAFAYQLDRKLTEQTACLRALTGDVALAAHECGEAIASSVVITSGQPSPHSIYRAMTQVEEARVALGTLFSRIKSFLPIGAGPAGENAGGGTA